MNIIKRIWGSNSTAEEITIAGGEFWIKRPETSPRAGRNSIFTNAQLTISKPSPSFMSELIVCPLNSVEDAEDDDVDDTDGDLRRLESERTFLVDAALKIAYYDINGCTVISWADPEGDAGDRYEFVCDENTKSETLEKFDDLCRTVQYGRKYGSAPPNSAALDEFDYDDEITHNKEPPKPKDVAEIKGTSIYEVEGTVCMFDGNRKVFTMQQKNAKIHLVETESYKYSLAAGHLGISIASNMNPISNEEHRAFIFNVNQGDGFATYMLQFSDPETLAAFEKQFAIVLWQSQNRLKWGEIEAADQRYIVEAYAPEEESADMTKGEQDESDDDAGDVDDDPDNFMEDDEAYHDFARSREINSAMEVGHTKDRAFVVRGSNIGVFKTGDDVQFSTTINNVTDLEKNKFTAQNIMLHEQDNALLMQDGINNDRLYRMDLEYGKVVEEWDMYGQVSAYAPLNKFAQATDESNLVAATDKSVYRVDPRLSGCKMVQDASKTYSKKLGFTAIATTEQGFVALGTKLGAISLYDKLGKRAKTAIPAVGEPVLALDVTADGEWLLATFKTYLLLIHTATPELNGFTKSFPKDNRPKPRRLQISPENAAFMYQDSGKPISFTPARFDTGPNAKEQSIITATGPYVVTWSLASILKNEPNPYRIKQYSAAVTADNFKYGTDNHVVVTLENNVGMVDRKALRKPTRRSLLSTDF